MSEPEPPFVPRERLIEKQKYFQSIYKHTYLKGPYDKITSVAIRAALAATCLFMIVNSILKGRGIYYMAHGIGKKECSTARDRCLACEYGCCRIV